MKLIRTASLVRRQKESIVHCEIELCLAPGASDRYLVNLRQGRMGEEWRETTRTPQPVALAEAETLFPLAVTERMAQGFVDPADLAPASIPAAALPRIDRRRPHPAPAAGTRQLAPARAAAAQPHDLARGRTPPRRRGADACRPARTGRHDAGLLHRLGHRPLRRRRCDRGDAAAGATQRQRCRATRRLRRRRPTMRSRDVANARRAAIPCSSAAGV